MPTGRHLLIYIRGSFANAVGFCKDENKIASAMILFIRCRITLKESTYYQQFVDEKNECPFFIILRL